MYRESMDDSPTTSIMDREASEVHDEEIEVEDTHAPEVEEEIFDGDNTDAHENGHIEETEIEAHGETADGSKEDELNAEGEVSKIDTDTNVMQTKQHDEEEVEMRIDGLLEESKENGVLKGANNEEVESNRDEMMTSMEAVLQVGFGINVLKYIYFASEKPLFTGLVPCQAIHDPLPK